MVKQIDFPKFKNARKIHLKALFLLFPLIFYHLLFWGRISPGVSIAGIPVGGKTPQEAINVLSRKIKPPQTIIFTEGEQIFNLDLGVIDFSYNFTQSTQAAYRLDKTGNFIYDLAKKILLPFQKPNIGLRINFDQKKLDQALSVIAGQVVIEPIYPSVKLKDNTLVVNRGQSGKELDIKKLQTEINYKLAYANTQPIPLPIKELDPTLTELEADLLKQRAQNLVGKKLELKLQQQRFIYQDNSLFKLLDAKDKYDKKEILNLTNRIAEKVNQPPQDATFVFIPDNNLKTKGRVQEFTPAKNGIKVEKDTLRKTLLKKLQILESSPQKKIVLDIPYTSIPPQIKTEDVNNLGIKELLGKGQSYFKGSISSRVHNIALAASKFNGILVAPGDTISFNDILGDVSLYTGYKQAYVIKNGKTVLGDGGGVCQVSTTLFRAALSAGLPIIERRAHSYRVSYYEQNSPVGLDATVYAPTTDLKIKNNTPAHLLIQTKIDTKKSSLVFEIYGTSDGRVAKVSKPKIISTTPPPDDLYIDDPTLPIGSIKQIDWKAWGAKVVFDYIIENNGEITYKKTFYSNYRPWQAVYLRGTATAP